VLRLPLEQAPTPVEALQALLDDGAVLLESRTAHPGARYSYVACSPLLEMRLYEGRLELGAPGEVPRRTVQGDAALATFMDWLETVRRMPFGDGETFAGGWVGWIGHEAGAALLDVPCAAAAPPARPAVPLAVMRLCPDVLVVDHHSGRAELACGDWGEGRAATQSRMRGLAARLEARDGTVAGSAVPAVSGPQPPTLDRAAYAREQARLQRRIGEGDCFQANLTSSWAYPWRDGTPDRRSLAALYARYAAANPGAWCGFFPDREASLLSASPELLVDWSGDALRMRPIAGTRPRGDTAEEDAAMASELRSDAKEQAEHAMLVDLARNDLARASVAGTVSVPSLGGVERYRHVMHLVSEVEGRARPGLTLADLLAAVFPGGTVTGAPKRRAVTRIAECERGPRGPYTGALGYAGVGGATQWNLLIRTLVATPDHLVVHAGCGIVADSRPESEAAELAHKARAQVDAALGRGRAAAEADGCGGVEPGPAWRPGRAAPRAGSADVLVVDFEDSFVHNLVDYCRRLGARVRVASAHGDPGPFWRDAPTHLLLSPGPGMPSDFPAAAAHVAEARRRGTPALGVCLGHQALAQADGAEVGRHGETVHGRGSRVVRTPAARGDPLLGAWKGSRIGRYHSLVVAAATARMETLATLEDGTLMAVRYRGRPHWGLQFHPESLLTGDGLDLIGAFLRVRA